MFLSKKACLFLLFCFAQNCKSSGALRKEWEVKDGKCPDCLTIKDDGPSTYFDFAVYKEQLFICDYNSKRIRVFDKNNKNTKNISFGARPEVFAVLGNSLFVLLRNGSISAYDIERDSLSSKKIFGNVTDEDYSYSFIVDSILTIPITNGKVSERYKALLINIKDPSTNDTTTIDYSRHIEMVPDTSFRHRPSTLVDLMGGDGRFLVFERFESNSTFTGSGLILLNRNDKTVKKMDPIPEEYGEIMHTWIGRGMKIYDGRVYFISEASGKSGNSIMIGSFALP